MEGDERKKNPWEISRRADVDVGAIGEDAIGEDKCQSPQEQAHAVLARGRWMARALLLAAVCALYVTAPRDGDFWWFDAPVHAMNGVFVRDFVAAAPLTDPVAFAENYFTVYPALSILFYPPLFYAAEAVLFELFGVHPWVAQLTVSAFTVVFVAGVVALCRTRLGVWPACAAALLALAMPATALWSRQVMLELPACALAVWSSHWLIRYSEERRLWSLLLAALLLCCALYTKQTVAFMIPVEIGFILLAVGTQAFRRREIWMAAGASAVLLLPLGIMTLVFGRFNFEQVAGLSAELPATLSLASLIWYAQRMPAETGWITLALAVLGCWYVARDRVRRIWPLFLLLGLWWAAGYAFFTVIQLKQPRHAFPVYLPVAVLAAVALDGIGRRLQARLLAPAVAIVLFGWTLSLAEVPRVTGHREAAAFVAGRVQVGDRIMFHGHRSGSFIFAMREFAGDGQPITTLRAEKFLVRYRIDRGFGLSDLGRSKEEIARIFEEYGVGYVVFQTDFWTDVPSIQRLEEVLRSDLFTTVAEFPIIGAEAPARLVVFEYKGPFAEKRAPIVIDIPAVGRKVEGSR